MKKYVKHHTALTTGYIGVNKTEKRPYNGRFGKGYVELTHNPDSTRFCFITYYVYED
ncbi:MAG: hypothetical protein [Bacteriophage sp.]|nr:MAG: hypothetical protein [Bacteriophage sp.]